MSDKLPDLDAASLQNRLGTFEAKVRPETQGKHGYQTAPLRPLRGKKERGLWDQFLSKKRVHPTLNWKEFLLLMAGMDPLALALLAGGRKILSMLHSPSPTRRPHVQPFNPLAGEKHIYIRVSSGDRAEAKAVGAKWDSDMKSWFIPQHHLKNRAAFSKWPVGLPEGRTETFSHKKAQELGACENQGLGLGD